MHFLPKNYVFSDETCRAVAEEMATTGLLNLLVVDRDNNRLVGSVGAAELLAGRRRAVKRELNAALLFKWNCRGPDATLSLSQTAAVPRSGPFLRIILQSLGEDLRRTILQPAVVGFR